MRKLFLISTIFFSFHISSFSQDTTRIIPKLNDVRDSITNFRTRFLADLALDSTNQNYLSPQAFDRFFDKYFTLLKYERESFTEGNSAALNVDDKASRLNLNLSYKKNSGIITVGTALNISDNSGLIFSGDKPTAGTEFTLSYSRLLLTSRLINFNGPKMFTNWAKRRELIDSVWRVHSQRNPTYGHIIKRQWSTINTNIPRFETSIQALQIHITRFTDSLNSVNQQLVSSSDTIRYRNFSDTLRIDNNALSLLQDSLVSALDKRAKLVQELTTLNDTTKSATEIAKAIEKSVRKIEIQEQLETDGVNSFLMTWLTGGINYRRDNYVTYDSTLQFSKRIGKQLFDKWTFNGAINFLWQRTNTWIEFLNSKFINSFYLNVNYSLVRTNNFEKLDEQGLNVLQSVSQNNVVYEFSSSKKIRDISGRSFSSSWIHKPGIVATLLFGKKQFWGLNLSQSSQFEKHQSPIFNFRTGLLFRFKDSEKENSMVNFEFFFAFNDLGDTKDEGKSVWQRKQIGISTTVPFKKVFFR